MRPFLITSRSPPVKPPIGHSQVRVVLLVLAAPALDLESKYAANARFLRRSSNDRLRPLAVFLATLGRTAAVFLSILAAHILDMDSK